MKFTDAGRVGVTVTAAPCPDGRASLTFAVRDTGIGLPKERLAAVFEPLTQADGSMTRRYGGTGPGLTISKKIDYVPKPFDPAQLIAVLRGWLPATNHPG